MIDIQNLSKTADGRKKLVKWAHMNLSPSYKLHEDDELWSYYNNDFPADKFNYLTQYGEFVLPAQVRHFPIQRPYVNYLSSRQVRRPFLFKTKASNKESKIQKRLAFIEQLLDELKMQMSVITMQETIQFQQVQSQFQQISQYAQQQPKDEVEAARIQEAKQILPMLQMQIQVMQMQMNNNKEKYQRVIDHTIKNKRKDIVDHIEEKCTKLIKNAIDKMGIRSVSLHNFITEVVTGKQYTYVDKCNGKFVYRAINPDNVFYSNEANADWVQDCEIAGFKEMMSLSQLINEFNLSSEEIKKLKSNYDMSGNSNYFVGSPGNKAVYISNGIDPADDEQGYEVKRVWWIYEKEVKYLKIKNKHNGKYFFKFLDNGIVINENEYSYNIKKRKWVSKNDPKIQYSDREVHRYNEDKDQHLERRYVAVRYRAVSINGEVIRSEEDEIQLWKEDDFTFNQLPIIGPTFNKKTDTPYSYIKATNGLQEFFNLLHYHEQLMLATAGTKTLLFDMVQKPANKSEREWMYDVKIGFAKLESYKKGIGRVAFNQFQEVDLSLSSSIQYINNIKQQVEDQVGKIFGVSRQAMGVTVNSDQVGTFELSQQSALLITEILYWRHDTITLKAIQMLGMLLTKYANESIDYIEDSDGVMDIIPNDYFTGRDFDFHLQDNTKEEQDLVTLKQVAMNYAAKAQFKLGEIVRLYDIDSLSEFKREVDELDRKMAELQQEMQSANETKAAQMRQEAMQMQNEYNMAVEREKNRLKEIELQIKQEEQRNKAATEQRKIEAQQQDNATKNTLKGIELANEQAMESAVLSENREARTMAQKIQLMQLQLTSIMNKLQIGKDRVQEQHNYEISKDKNEIEKTKARKMVKEHVSDK